MKALESKIEAMVKPLGVELYDTELTQEHGRDIFRVYITSKKGVSLDKCEEVSRLISPLLDVDEPTHKEYFFEVSSPGIERKLTKPRHFASAVGEKAKVKLMDGTTFRGMLKSCEEDVVTIEDTDEAFTFHIQDVKSAKTFFDWDS